MAVLYGLRHVVYSVLFSYINRSKAGDCVQSRLTILSRTDERRTDSPLKRQFFKAAQVYHLFASSRVLYGDALFEGIILESFRFWAILRSMTTCCAVNVNMDSGDTGNQYCMTKYGSSYPQIVY